MNWDEIKEKAIEELKAALKEYYIGNAIISFCDVLFDGVVATADKDFREYLEKRDRKIPTVHSDTPASRRRSEMHARFVGIRISSETADQIIEARYLVAHAYA